MDDQAVVFYIEGRVEDGGEVLLSNAKNSEQYLGSARYGQTGWTSKASAVKFILHFHTRQQAEAIQAANEARDNKQSPGGFRTGN
jgi:hypothetical protein